MSDGDESGGSLERQRQTAHTFDDLVRPHGGKAQAQGGVVGVGGIERGSGTKATPLSMARLASSLPLASCHLRPSGVPRRTGRPWVRRIRWRCPNRGAAHRTWLGTLGTHGTHFGQGGGMRPALQVLGGSGLGKGAGVGIAELFAHGGLGQQLGRGNHPAHAQAG